MAHTLLLIRLVTSLLSVYFVTRTLAALARLSSSHEIENWFTSPDKRSNHALSWEMESELFHLKRAKVHSPVSTKSTRENLADLCYLASLLQNTESGGESRLSSSAAMLEQLSRDPESGGERRSSSSAAMLEQLSRDPESGGERRPSLSAAMLLVAPSRLLAQSVGSFLLGFGVYLISVYHRDLKIMWGAGGSVVLMVVFIVLTTYKLLFHQVPFKAKSSRDSQLERWNVLANNAFRVRGVDRATKADRLATLYHEYVSNSGGTDRLRDSPLLEALAKQAPASNSASGVSSGDPSGAQGAANESTEPSEQALSPNAQTAHPSDLGVGNRSGLEPLLVEVLESQKRSTLAIEALLHAYQQTGQVDSTAGDPTPSPTSEPPAV